MALGVITANVADAGDVCDALSSRGQDHVLMGNYRWGSLLDLLGGRFIGMDLRGLGEGQVPSVRLIKRIRERGVGRVVNAGTLSGLLDTTGSERVGRSRRHLDDDVETQKLAALKLEQVLRTNDIEVAWLAEAVPEFRAGVGVLNGVDLPLPEGNLRSAVRRAMQASAQSPVACAWIDNGPGSGMRTFDTDEKLKNLAVQPAPPHRRLLIKVAAHPDHSPLDPPMVGPPTIKWAMASHVSAILIDAARGVIASREKTLRKAAEAGIAVVGV